MSSNAKLPGIFLVLGDYPPSMACLKRLALFHNHIVIPAVEDKAFVNEGEIREDFPGFGTAVWAERGKFPRSDCFEERMIGIRRETISLQEKGLISFVPSTDSKATGSDPKLRLFAYASAISSEKFIRAALPDLDFAVTPPIPDTIFLAPKWLRWEGDRVTNPRSDPHSNWHSQRTGHFLLI
jgi:hypothetical protein